MSAQSPVAALSGYVDNQLSLSAQSYSSATPEGLAAQLASELYWQSMIAQASGGAGATRAVPSDPLFGMQWHLVNSAQQVGAPDYQNIFGVLGEDLNVAPVYNAGITGQGVRVAVMDSGVQLNHPDLAANIDASLAFDALNPFFGDGNPTLSLLQPGVAHGTAVAGLIGAVADNGLGGAGVAPGVTLVPIRLIDIGQTPDATAAAFRHVLNNNIDITNNSWGPSDALRTLAGPTLTEYLAIQDSIVFGRDLDGPGGNPALGVINIWASGNGGAPNFLRPGFPGIGAFDQSNYDGYANLRYTIAVGGVDHDGGYNNFDGTVTAYPEAGANVLVVAPTGSVFTTVGLDIGTGSGLVTTDLTGDFGYNGPNNPQTGEDFDRDFLPDKDYMTRFNGTSGAAPLVAGVVALMLEANPNLSWRDVQEILVRSARQNAQFEVPTVGGGTSTQNTWITNQVPQFSDPDPFILGVPIAPDLRTLNPLLDPNNLSIGGFYFDGRLVPDHRAADPFKLTNGAGYTVSQGRGTYGEMIGYGHGTVDAELAVQMAQQWHAKDQDLPSESTFTTFVTGPGNTPSPIPAAAISNMPSGFQVVPGGIVPGTFDGTFIDFWNEYFETSRVPFSQPNPPTNDRGGSIAFSVPDPNTMTIESVDVKLAFSADSNPDEILNHMRIMLVSPDGTQSDLNNYFLDLPTGPFQYQVLEGTEAFPVIGTPQGVGGSGLATFVWNFNTNRSWGERSDDAIVFDPVTGEPVVDQFGLAGAEIAWHGSSIAAESQRVQGFVGIDDTHDKDFNFSRVIQTVADLDGDPTTFRLGEVTTEVDLTQESFAPNVTVTVRRTADNSLVDQFVTGHDGNFYFDLLPDDYTFTIEDPLGRTALDDSTTGPQYLRHYQSEWQITADWFNVWDHDSNFTSEVFVDPITGVPAPWLDGNGQEQEYGMKGINFLLDPGPVVAPQATFQGTVVADTNGDGEFNPNDVALPGVTVFGDINRNGVRDSGEATAVTNAQGQYTLVVPAAATTVVNVGVVRPSGWTSTNDGPGTADSATDGLEAFFVQPGSLISNANFSIQPPANNTGTGGANQPGYLMGVVFADTNGDGIRQTAETGAAGFRVYLDNNNSGTFDAGDTQTTTNQFGAWAFGNVAPGQRVVRLETFSPFAQTLPSGNGARVVTLTGSSTISNIVFGVRNTAILDFGDLPSNYPVASHRVGAYWLGASVDAELASSQTAGADGDDLTGIPDDEDGIEFLTPLTPGGTATIRATASRNNGYLQAWADWNNDGDFNDVGERIITNRLLQNVAAQNEISFAVPAGAGANVFIRFRYGEFASGANAISTPTGQALTGEVEDYLRTVPVAPAVIAGMPADFDQDEDVDGFDFLAWQRNLGRTGGATQAQGNANGDAAVTSGDLHMWKNEFGTLAAAQDAASAALTAGGTGDFNGDQDVDGSDFLALQRNFGKEAGAQLAQGDSNGDGRVNATDVGAWKGAFGNNSATAMAIASSTAGANLTKSSYQFSVELVDAARQWSLNADSSASALRRPASRALFDVAAGYRLSDAADLDDRLDAVPEFVHSLITDAASGVVADYQLLRRDRAFEDLLGSRRRQGLAEAADGTEATVEDCDELFAALADHGQWPLD